MKKIYLVIALILLSLSISAQNYDIYVSDAGNFSNPPWQILKFDQSGANPQVFINTNLGWPQDILFLENQNIVLVSNLNTNSINRYEAATGQYIDAFASGISGPTRMKIGADSLLYVLQWSGNGRIIRYDLSGNFIDEFTNTGVSTAIGIDWDSQGNLYISSYTGNLIHKFDTSGNDSGVFISGNIAGPTNIWFDNNDNLYIVEYNAGKVSKFDSSGNFIQNFITGLSQPEGVAFTPNGEILIGDGGTSSVKEFSSNGMFNGNLISAGSGNLLKPNAVVLRSVPVSDLNEISNEYFNIVPTIGSKFTIDFHNTKISEIKIFNIMGKFIKEFDNVSNLIWNAEKEIAGVYVFHVTLEDGRIISRKVIVQ